MEVGKQRTLFKIERPSGSIFNEETMEAINKDGSSESTRGKSVLAVAFPLVTRWGTPTGAGYDKCVVVMKAQVLV